MAMAQTAFGTRRTLNRSRSAAANRMRRAEMPLFQAFLCPFSEESTDRHCIKDSTTIDETIWLTQKAMGELFQVESHTINYHLREIYKTNELSEVATTRKIRVVQQEGKRQVERELQYYNLDAIISVGYRVNSKRATHFRIWATGVLREYMIKGFALDDERLKQGKTAFGKDYFRELLERVRSIRASERRIWQQVTGGILYCAAIRIREREQMKNKE